MTMKHLHEPVMTMPAIDIAKWYQYTWPGQPPKVVSGAELATICKGADASMLAIKEVKRNAKAEDPPPPPPVPSAPEPPPTLPEDAPVRQ